MLNVKKSHSLDKVKSLERIDSFSNKHILIQ